MTEVNLVAAVLAGAATFLSPCVLPLLPGYISLMSGYSMQELAEGDVSMRRVVGMTGLFVLGFTTVFVGLGATATSISSWLANPAFTVIAGWVIVVMGLFIAITAVWTPSWLLPVMRERRVESHGARRFGYFGPPIMGAAFAFGWTPCIGPFLASALLLGTSDEPYSHEVEDAHELPATAAIGEEGLRVHDLRHTCASLLIATEAQADHVREHLGHSSINVTMNVYGHLYEDKKDEVALRLETLRNSGHRAAKS